MNVLRVVRNIFNVRAKGDCMPIAAKNCNRLTLADCWNKLGYKLGAEIGVNKADYSLELLNRIPDCHLICVDIWEEYKYNIRTKNDQDKNYQIACNRLQPFIDNGRVTILKMSSMQAVEQYYDNSLDFVFIDGDHTFDYCCMDIIRWSQKVRSGGMIGVHDYLAMRKGGVMKAVEAYTHCHNISPWFVTREIIPTAFWIKP